MTLLIWLVASSLLWGGVLWLAGRLLQRSPNVSGRARQWIWRGAMALLIAPWIAAPLVTGFGLGLGSPGITAIGGPVSAAGGETLVTMSAADLAPVATTVVENGGSIWAALGAMTLAEMALMVLVAGWLVRFVAAQLALRHLLGIVMLSRKANAGVAHGLIGRWSQRLKLRTAPDLRVVQEQHSPFSYGALRPTVCVPEGLEEKLSQQSLDLVVGHECVHVARGDGWLRPLERAPADILWFNPFAWLIRRELDVARELAVDEAVVAMAESRMVYARTLREVAGIAAGLPLGSPVASMSLGDGRNLMLRVSRTLADARREPARAAMFAACLVGLAGAPIAVAQVILVVPAPPAPPALPADVSRLAVRVVAPEAPEAPEAAEALEAPEAPEAPPAAEFEPTDGTLRATFRSRVVAASGDSASGYRVELLQTAPGPTGDTCLARLDGLGALSVSKDQTVNPGDAVGRPRAQGATRVSITCSDQLDGEGRPAVGDAPEPPIPPEPIMHVPPVAPVAPVSRLAPPAPLIAPTAPVSPTPMTPPTPPAPLSWQGQQPSPLPSPAPRPAPSPTRGDRTVLTLDGASHAVITAPARVTGVYGYRVDPIRQQTAFHQGVDLAASTGTPVYAPVQGQVRFAAVAGSRGNMVTVQAPDGAVLSFAQLDEIKVKVGQMVSAGDVVGTVGSSGLSTGPHLHLEVSMNGVLQDPQRVAGLTLVSGQ